jgi:hypothetical protein
MPLAGGMALLMVVMPPDRAVAAMQETERRGGALSTA